MKQHTLTIEIPDCLSLEAISKAEAEVRKQAEEKFRSIMTREVSRLASLIHDQSSSLLMCGHSDMPENAIRQHLEMIGATFNELRKLMGIVELHVVSETVVEAATPIVQDSPYLWADHLVRNHEDGRIGYVWMVNDKRVSVRWFDGSESSYEPKRAENMLQTLGRIRWREGQPYDYEQTHEVSR